jgi:glycosyltransferase involved in cell wall biosynthesis
MRVLFVHQNFPGQYLHLAPALAARGDEVIALAIEAQKPLPGVGVLRYKPQRGSAADVHPWVSDIETKVIRGEAAAQAAQALRAKGFRPDVICAHPGWGEALFLKDVFPEAPLLSFIEFFYRADGADFGFDPEFGEDGVPGRCRLRMKNANSLLNIDAADWCISPTEWQASTVPERYRDRFSVVHDGVDTDRVRPNPDAVVKLAKASRTLRPGDEVITFVNRNMEPYRGFHIFMRALPEIQRRRPNAITIVVGGDDVSYGKRLPQGQTWRQKLLAEVGDRLDMNRVRFVGRIPYPDFVAMLQISAVHVYLTYPFVLSWSMLEAMAAGCAVVGSATPPVQEVIRDGDNGVLVDFFSTEGIADAVDKVLSHPDRMAEMRVRARQTVIDRYDLRRFCLPRHIALVDAVAGRRLPPDLASVPAIALPALASAAGG